MFIRSVLMVPSLHHQLATAHWSGRPLLPSFLLGWLAPGPRRQPGRPLVGDSTPLTPPLPLACRPLPSAAGPAIWPPSPQHPIETFQYESDGRKCSGELPKIYSL